MTFTTTTVTDRNHTATLLVDGDALQLFFDDAQYPIARVAWDTDRSAYHMFSDADDANGDYADLDTAYVALLDWAQTDCREMANTDEDAN